MRGTAERWADRTEVRQYIAEYQAKLAEATQDYHISDQQARIESLNIRWHKLHQVVEERGEDPSLADVAGGTTGLVVRRYKGVGYGRDSRIVEEFEVDTALLAELRATELQAAKELGQLVEHRELSGPGGGPIRVSVTELLLIGAQGGESSINSPALGTAQPRVIEGGTPSHRTLNSVAH